MSPSLKTLAAVFPLLSVAALGECTYAPKVAVKNGTLQGLYNPAYNQDFFLGVPYAQPPVGKLRLQNPQIYNSTYDVLSVVKYADSCVGYGVSFQTVYHDFFYFLFFILISPSARLGTNKQGRTVRIGLTPWVRIVLP
jgi:hypothetical protein